MGESLIIVEFLADLYPQTGLLPQDPVQKAKARVFASLIDTVLVPAVRKPTFQGTGDFAETYKAFDMLQSLLPDGAKYAVGDEFTVADVSAAPLFGMIEVLFSNDIGRYPPADGLKAFEVYSSSKYDKLRGYVKRVLEQKSGKKIIDAVSSQASSISSFDVTEALCRNTIKKYLGVY